MPESINRAFMYGESVFTTMRLIHGRPVDWDHHFDRLRKSVEFLYGPFTDGDDWALLLRSRLDDRLALEEGDKILRLTIYREQARGLMKTGLESVNALKVLLHSSAYDPLEFEDKLFHLRTCSAAQKPNWWPSFLKAGSYLETILAQKMFMQAGDDDVLFLSSSDTVLESSVSNIFVVRHNKLYTPPLGPNVLGGVMRRRVLDVATDFFDACEETETSYEQLLKADMVFGTNSVRGPFLIAKIDEHTYHYDTEAKNNFALLRKRVFG